MGPLTAIVALPIVGAIALSFVDPEDHKTLRFVAMVFAVAAFVASLVVVARFDTAEAGFQLVEQLEWIPSIGASYKLGVDGISLVLVVLTTFLTPLILLASWRVDERVKGYFASFLVLEGAVLGVFLTLDLLLFYVFWEVMLVPMYLIIGIWGSANRRYAAIKFFLYTLLGGLLMLVAILFLFSEAGSFDYATISQLELSQTAQGWLFLAFFVAFAVKVPLFPVHTWLPDAHTEAPTGGSVFLAGILLKMGAYGVLRYSLPIFPDATVDFAPWIIGLSVVGILYGAVLALMQPDVKRLIAYSSVSHMGFVMLGIFALTLTSASAGVVQMVNHGLSTGALFLLVGFLYERRHTRAINAYGGLAKVVPVMAGFWLVVSLSSLALPGLNGFVGEFPILLGAFQTTRWAAVLGAFGAVLAALYLLWVYQRMFHGPVAGPDNEHTTDLHFREVAILTPLVILIVAIGVYPKPLYDTVEPSVDRVLQQAGLSGVGTADVEGVAPIEGAGR
ncbi:MAG: NADH-quinone oxidoreductase subunit M [Nitriliruptorales bacterium]|nr:NADH-quinone oxidoreductase subunit M [Nitriliruptorales bacterium]